MTLAGGYTDVETPSSIPNLEAKHIMADDTGSSLTTICFFLKQIMIKFFT